MNQSSLEFALCKLMDLGGGKAAGSGSGNTGDIRLEMLKFTRQKTPDIGGENIVLIFHIRREGEEPAGGEADTRNGTNACAGAAAAAGAGTADMPAGASGDTPAETPIRGKILEA